jgi:hypothetical protein
MVNWALASWPEFPILEAVALRRTAVTLKPIHESAARCASEKVWQWKRWAASSRVDARNASEASGEIEICSSCPQLTLSRVSTEYRARYDER